MAFGLCPLLKADAANLCANLEKVPGVYICVVVLKRGLSGNWSERPRRKLDFLARVSCVQALYLGRSWVGLLGVFELGHPALEFLPPVVVIPDVVDKNRNDDEYGIDEENGEDSDQDQDDCSRERTQSGSRFAHERHRKKARQLSVCFNRTVEHVLLPTVESE